MRAGHRAETDVVPGGTRRARGAARLQPAARPARRGGARSRCSRARPLRRPSVGSLGPPGGPGAPPGSAAAAARSPCAGRRAAPGTPAAPSPPPAGRAPAGAGAGAGRDRGAALGSGGPDASAAAAPPPPPAGRAPVAGQEPGATTAWHSAACRAGRRLLRPERAKHGARSAPRKWAARRAGARAAPRPREGTGSRARGGARPPGTRQSAPRCTGGPGAGSGGAQPRWATGRRATPCGEPAAQPARGRGRRGASVHPACRLADLKWGGGCVARHDW